MAISLVQSASVRAATGGSTTFSVSVTLSPTVAGNCLFVAMSIFGSSGGTQSVTDSNGNTYTLAVDHNRPPDNAQIWFCKNALGGSGSTVVTWASIGAVFQDVSLVAGELSGVDTVTALDQTASQATGASTSPSSTAVSTTPAGEFYLSALCFDTFGTSGAITVTTGSGWTNLYTDSGLTGASDPAGGDIQYQIGGAGGSYTGTWTTNQAVFYSACIASFAPAATPAGGSKPIAAWAKQRSRRMTPVGGVR